MRRVLVWAALAAALFAASPLTAARADYVPRWHRTAVALVGTPYVYGGSAPGGMDCSGFVRYVVGTTTGTWLAHNAAAMSTQVRHVPFANVREGDLLFFDYFGGGIDHVELALGNGYMVGTSNTVEDADVDAIDWSALVAVGRIDAMTADVRAHKAMVREHRRERRERHRHVLRSVALSPSVGRI